jgi:GH15 family glucan-1,4-alpha-glucosidase
LVFTLTLKPFDTLFARISDFTLVVIQLSDTTRSALLAALDGATAASSDAASAMFEPSTSPETRSAVPRVMAMRDMLLGFGVVVIGHFQVYV